VLLLCDGVRYVALWRYGFTSLAYFRAYFITDALLVAATFLVIISFYEVIFGRTSLAARRGYKASSALTPLWADRTLCENNDKFAIDRKLPEIEIGDVVASTTPARTVTPWGSTTTASCVPLSFSASTPKIRSAPLQQASWQL
jgi:hypothetical protein